MCLKIGQLVCGHMSLFNYYCVFKTKNSLDYFQSLKLLPLIWWHVAHHGAFINHLTHVLFKTPIISWHVAIKAQLFFNFKILINEI
jgi:hypothetical protein